MKKIKELFPGLLFTATIAWISVWIQHIPFVERLHFSSLIVAILLGILIKNLFPIPNRFHEGIHFSLKKVLRLAIILLGFRLSFTEMTQIGGKGLLLVSIVTTATILFAVWLGKRLGLDKELSILIGAGTGICGASAVAAVAPVVDAEEKDTTFAIATVTIFGTIAMFLYPIMYKLLHLPSILYAVWAGTSIHEVAQVVAAGFAAGDEAGQFATVVKLSRVLLVIPAAIILGYSMMKQRDNGEWSTKKITIPWFVFGFGAIVIINSLHILPSQVTNPLIHIDGFLLTLAMAGMGLETSMEKMKKVGMRPFYVGLSTSIFISLFGFLMAKALFF